MVLGGGMVLGGAGGWAEAPALKTSVLNKVRTKIYKLLEDFS
jgi:hypothetical protein